MTATGDSATSLLRSWRFAFWAVLLLSFALYISTLSGRPVWDDNQILSGEGIGGGTISGAISQPFLHGYFRPLVALFLLFENTLFHGSTFYYHLVNVLLHVAGCAVLIGLLLECFRSRKIALLGGFFFAIHPVLVSTISWIGGITDCLGTLLVLLFAYTLVLSLRETPKKLLWSALSAVFFLLALFCKEQTIALILLVPLAALAFDSQKKSLPLIVPYAAGAIFFLILWKIYFPGYPDITWGLTQRVQVIGQTLAYYVLILFFPTGKWLQTYTLGSFASSIWVWTFLGFLFVAAFVFAWFRILRADKGLAWFGAFLLLALLPVANIIPPPSLVVAPYRAGLAVVGLAALFAIVLIKYVPKNIALGVGAVFSIWWLAMASTAIAPWLDQTSLFTTIVQEDPTFLQARENLAITLMSSSQDQPPNPKEAATVLEGLLDQVFGSSAWRAPDGGASIFQTDQKVQAQVILNKGPMSGENWLSDVFNKLGEARARSGDIRGAITAFQGALGIRPTNFTSVASLAQLAMATGDKAAARQYLDRANQLKPGDPGVAQMLQSLGK